VEKRFISLTFINKSSVNSDEAKASSSPSLLLRKSSVNSDEAKASSSPSLLLRKSSVYEL